MTKVNLSKSTRAFKVISLLFLTECVTSCKKLVDIPPPEASIAENSVYTINATATAVLTSMYSGMNNTPFQGTGGLSFLAGITSDELTYFSIPTNSQQIGYYRNLLSVNALGSGFETWAPLYNNIFRCNAAIEGLGSSKAASLTPLVRQQLAGEARFMRAFFYFYLVNLYGDVPLVVSTDPKVNTLLPRSPKTDVYVQIIDDLKKAQNMLSSNYLDQTLLATTTERIRPTKWAATALLARTYLYSGKYADAEEQASALIANSSLYELLPQLNDVFVKNSREAIWQIQPVSIGFNTLEAQIFIIPSGGSTTSKPTYISNQLLRASENGDLRFKPKNWIDTITLNGTLFRFPYKYKDYLNNPNITTSTGSKNMTEYYMVLRVAEQYLIRAEARAMQNNLQGAISDIDKIRGRAGLTLIANTNPGISQTALLDTILHERQVELFTEWGHRWLDLKRTGKVDQVMTNVTPLKVPGAVWQSYQQLFPIPQETINSAPNVRQNPGY